MNSKRYSIKLLNKTFDIMCPEESFIKLQKSAQKLNQHLLAVKKSSKNLTEYQLLLMAALNLTSEYVTYQENQEQLHDQVSAFVEYFAEKQLANNSAE